MKKLFFLLIALSPFLAFAQPCATLVAPATTTPTSCSGSADGSISVTATATAGPITYSIGSTTNSTGMFTGLAMAPYTVYATDANNCQDSILLFVTSPAPLGFTNVTTTSPSCNPGNDGVICLSASGGTGSLIYILQPNIATQLNNCFSNLGAGVYAATVTDANGCTANTSIALTTPPAMQFTAITSFNLNPCDPDTIQAFAFGGIQPISYSITPNAVQPSPGTFFTSTSGVYIITATDANNCSVSSVFTMANGAPSISSMSSINPQCGQTNGSISANVSWGTNPFTYVLNPGNISNTTGVFNNLASGTYVLSVQNTSCPSGAILDSFNLVNKLNPFPITTTQNTFTATVPTNGTAPYVYTLNSQVIASPLSGLRCTGVDTFTITDAGGCSFDTTFSFVAGNTFPSITLNKNINDATCALTGDGQIIYAPSATLTYEWLANASVASSTASSLSGLMPDNYVVKLHNLAGDCIQDTSIVGAIGTSCGNISGKAFYDTLVNCVYDTLEIPTPNITVTLMPGNIQKITNALGEYEFLGLAYGNYTVEVDTNFTLGLYPSCNLLQYDTLSATNINDTNDFPYDHVSTIDLYANTYATPKVPAAPAQSWQKTQVIYYGYTGVASIPIDVNLYALMDSISHYDTSSVSPTSIMGDTLMWTLTNINSGTSPWANQMLLYYDNFQNMTIGQSMPLKVWIEPITAIVGNNLANDSASVLLPIATSFDPNDKQVSPQGHGAQGYIDPIENELSYLVRFQNTGNAMAYNVAIEDTISNKLDINSLRVLSASHAYLIEKENNLIRFKFDNIMLADSNADEPNSHGYIQYSIQQDAGNIPGDAINNTAHIYFDFNPAVITNTTINTIRFPISVENITAKNFRIYPNPTHDLLFVEGLSIEIKDIKIYDLIGREVSAPQQKIGDKRIQVSLNDLPIGVYLLQVNNETFKVSKN